MNRKIKIMWLLSVVSAILVFCVQTYGLYCHLRDNIEHNAYGMRRIITEAFEEDQKLRYALVDNKNEGEKNSAKSVMFTEKKDSLDSVLVNEQYHKKSNKATAIMAITVGGHRKTVELRDMEPDYAIQLSNRYEAQHARRFNKIQFDSILVSMGCDTTATFRQYVTKRCIMRPQFEITGGIRKTLSVEYSVNPVEHETVFLTIPVPVGKAISAMGWLLLFSELLFGILSFCMIYLIRIIVFQKRIDRLRHEYMKNIMYEQKAAPEFEPTPADVVRIGRTDFYYKANELILGSDRVIITSRQAEILRMLVDKKNNVVSREELLLNVWGDDSPSNSNALNVQITYLRRALRFDETVNIEAVIRKGYRLNETIE